eukprot:g13611.t1
MCLSTMQARLPKGVDVLINNAGTNRKGPDTPQGYEQVWGTNYVAPTAVDLYWTRRQCRFVHAPPHWLSDSEAQTGQRALYSQLPKQVSRNDSCMCCARSSVERYLEGVLSPALKPLILWLLSWWFLTPLQGASTSIYAASLPASDPFAESISTCNLTGWGLNTGGPMQAPFLRLLTPKDAEKVAAALWDLTDKSLAVRFVRLS